MPELHDLTAVQQLDRLQAGDLEPIDLVEHYLSRIDRLDSSIGAFVTVTPDAARAAARTIAAGARRGSLHGLPFADKDLVPRAGVPTRFGSRLFVDHVPDVTGDQAAVWDEAGAISLGKTTTPEFGLTGYTETLIGPPTRDPWDARNGAGGSSGGAAAAVAAGLLPIAPASDGGGSIRIPAATVGVVGLKPSRGRVPFATGLDGPAGLVVAGPIARTVEDAALALEVMVAGRPYRHATGAPGPTAFLQAARAGTARVRVGVTTVSPWDDDEDIRLDRDAAAAVDVASALLSDAGNAVEALTWHPRGYAEMFRTIWRASAARVAVSDVDLARVEGITAWLVREGRGLGAESALGALAAATEFERQTIAAFSSFDVVLTPALAETPRPVGWFDADDALENFAQQVRYAPYSSFVNVAGLPALTLPVTTSADGHPVSVQLIGRPGGESTILAVAAELECRAGIDVRPPVWTR